MSIFGQFGTEEQSKIHSTIAGVTLAEVTNTNDPENMGRVKVRFINGDKSGSESDFIGVASPMTGKECGIMFHPSIGNIVLVFSAEGDMSRSYVAASLWTKQDLLPPEVKGEKRIDEVDLIKTRGGHILMFDNKKGNENILLKTSSGLSLKMDDKEKKIEVGDAEKNKQFISVDVKSDAITIEVGGKIELKAGSASLVIDGKSNSISIKCNGNLSIDGQQVSIEGKAAIGVKANGNLDLQSGGPASIKGAIVKIN